MISVLCKRILWWLYNKQRRFYLETCAQALKEAHQKEGWPTSGEGSPNVTMGISFSIPPLRRAVYVSIVILFHYPLLCMLQFTLTYYHPETNLQRELTTSIFLNLIGCVYISPQNLPSSKILSSWMS